MDIIALVSRHSYRQLVGNKQRLTFFIELGENVVHKYAKGGQITDCQACTPKLSRLVEHYFPAPIPPTTEEKSTNHALYYEKKVVGSVVIGVPIAKHDFALLYTVTLK